MGDVFSNIGPGVVIVRDSVVFPSPARRTLRCSEIVRGLAVREVSSGRVGVVVEREYEGRFLGAVVRFEDGVSFVRALDLEVV